MPTIALSLLSGGFFLHSLSDLPAWPLCAAILLFSLVLRAGPVFHVLAGFLAGAFTFVLLRDFVLHA